MHPICFPICKMRIMSNFCELIQVGPEHGRCHCSNVGSWVQTQACVWNPGLRKAAKRRLRKESQLDEGWRAEESTPRGPCWDPTSSCKVSAPSTVGWLPVAYCLPPQPGGPWKAQTGFGVSWCSHRPAQARGTQKGHLHKCSVQLHLKH